MAITKIQSESLNLADNYDFTGTVTGAGESNAPSFRVYRNTTQSISSASHTKIQFNTEVYDTGSAFDNSTNYRYTIPSGHAGKWFFTCHGTIAQDQQDLNRLILSIRKNGSTLVNVEEDGAYDEYTMGYSISVCDNASVGDYYEVFIYQINSGSDTLNLQANTMNGFSGFKISS